MKKITMFMMESCPYCRQAERWMEELFREHPEYRDVELERVDELKEPERAAQWNYYYVPTYYVGDAKLHEGAATKEKVQRVFETALKG